MQYRLIQISPTYSKFFIRVFKKVEQFSSYVINNIFRKRPSYRAFLFMICFWCFFSIIVSSLYDPATEINPVWWLNTFLVIDGMVVCLIIPYRGIFKYILWYVFFSMVFATFILSLVLIHVIASYKSGELSMLYTYQNAMLEPLLGLIQEIINSSSNNPTQCVGSENITTVKAVASSTTNVVAQNSQGGGSRNIPTTMNALLNGAALGSAAVAIFSATPRVKVIGLSAVAVGVAATYLSGSTPPPTAS